MNLPYEIKKNEIDSCARNFSKSDPINRDHLISILKLKAEAALEETEILLGWKLHTHTNY